MLSASSTVWQVTNNWQLAKCYSTYINYALDTLHLSHTTERGLYFSC